MDTASQILARMTRDNNSQTRTPSQPQRSDRASAAQLTALADDAAAWLLSRWPGQLGKLAPAARHAALEGWREVLSEMTPAAITRARDNWRQPYPPDPAAFQAAGERQDAAEQYHLAAQAAGCQPPVWHTLERRTFHAATAVAAAGFNLREAAWGHGEGAAARAWLKHYREACRQDDLAMLAPPPAPPRAALAHKRDQSAADRGCTAMRAILDGTMAAPSTPPPPPPEWVQKMAAQGVIHKP